MKGRYLYINNDEQWISKGRHIYKSNDNGLRWAKQFSIPCNLFVRFLFKISFIVRLLRLGIHHFIKIDETNAVCVFNKEIIWLELQTNKVVHRNNIYGNRPLSFIKHNKNIIYGEYRGNNERSAVHVWMASVDDKIWKPAFEIEDVRHIHGVYDDPFTKTFWITTGDENDEARVIIINEDFLEDRTLIQGDQQARIVQPIFTEKFVYFASDAPNEVNFIYRYNRQSGKIESLQAVSGPIYFGQSVGNMLFFSTVVEPSSVNNQTTIELWASLDGILWKCVSIFYKDYLSFKYFQYGQIIFANHQTNKNVLCFSEIATKEHLKMHQVDIDELKTNYFK